MTEQIKVSQVLAQVEGDLTPQIKVSQVLSQVEGGLTPQIKVSQLMAQVECAKSPILVQATGSLAIGGAATITFSAHGSATVTVTSGSLAVGGPATVIFSSNVRTTITASGSLAVGGPATVIFTSAGIATITATGNLAIGGPATIWSSMLPVVIPAGPFSVIVSAQGGIAVGGSTTIYSSTVPIATYVGPFSVVLTATGNIAVGGPAEITFATPDHFLIQADTGRIAIGGPASVVMGRPIHAIISASGSLAIGGSVKAVFSPPATPKVVQVISGSLAIGGPATALTGHIQSYLIVASQGSLQVGSQGDVTVSIGRAQTAVITASHGGIEVGGESETIWSSPGTSYLISALSPGADTGLKIGGATGPFTFTHPRIMQVICEGFLAIGGEPDLPADEVYDTYVLNGNAYEPSIFSGWNFNSYAMYRGKAYGAGKDGLYLLEGSDDDGVEIHTGVRVGPINFGTGRQKRLRTIRIENCGDNAQVKITTAEGDVGYFDVEESNAAISRDLQSREFTIDVSGFKELSQFEIIPLILASR